MRSTDAIAADQGRSSDELDTLIESEGETQLVNVALRWADLLGLVRLTKDGKYLLNPIIGRILSLARRDSSGDV